ncbi:hypothetical protein [Paludibaculum fermentans]|uniref:Cytochrome c n=1 Tax=Paludibaculum fermentans TaxID=1473598 RepID=A0A7S7NQU8_PALFE|nr:hypothetical protein [Paludibaculum fermentans]QOY88126.1 hypothetical protein IRI77_36225 [Paludibaculum fermentans]
MRCKLLTGFVFAVLASAGTAEHRKQSMDAAQEWKEELWEALSARDAKKSAKLAGKLAALGKAEEAEWKKAGQEDVRALAAQNSAAAREVLLSARAGRFEQALQAFGRLEATCRGCHDLHPEKRPPVR